MSSTTLQIEPDLSNAVTLPSDEERRRRVRRNAWLLTGVALAFYAAFIVLSIRSGHR